MLIPTLGKDEHVAGGRPRQAATPRLRRPGDYRRAGAHRGRRRPRDAARHRRRDRRPRRPCDEGYWNNPEATAETLRGGWHHTGDVGYLDEDGYLYITDRQKDMIISGGANIYPREVEEVICTHPAVHEVAVIGVPDETWGESVRAMVVLRPGQPATAAEIIEHCRRHLASYKKPSGVEFLPELPKNAYGKILKRELREPFWQGRTRRV